MFPNQGFDMNANTQNPQWAVPGNQVPNQQAQSWGRAGNQAANNDADSMDVEEGDNTRRPPNAFILYSQAMRSQVRQENPSLSNTECSRLLGKMWKDVPHELKLQYKQKAASMQEEFKREHPDYTYRKARRKRALNELLTKSSHGYPQFMAGGYPGQEMQQWQTMMNPQNNNQTMFSMGMPQYQGQQGNPMTFQPGMFPMGQMQGMPQGHAMFSMNQFQPK